jgi:hypothetical protein
MKILRRIVHCSAWSGAIAFLLVGCDSGTTTRSSVPTASGGYVGSGGTGSGGANPSGGSGDTGATGGKAGTGGMDTGGAVGSGGHESGGATGTGGQTGLGGIPGGDAGVGGSAQGGSSGRDGGFGGSPRDGAGRGDGPAGTDGGGASGGSTGAGGSTVQGGAPGAGGTSSTGPCTVTDWGTPPTGDAKWIDESWASELGSNVKNRKEWLLDSAILGKGQINVCVRWGASSAPSTDLKTNVGSWIEKWFNDWLMNLSDYGCFPYSHIAAKVTGWAVRKGNESWVSDLDSSTVKVYTDVEAGSTPANEPKCADACSFFTADGAGRHSFPSCPGGEAFHFDYSLWLDDKLPDSNAAAVGGDWGLRMPAGDFISLKGGPSSVVEHEMGHGFGFQDYYDWKQDKPADGSLMIVGSSKNQTPTLADVWLLRRTWKEVKALRGW